MFQRQTAGWENCWREDLSKTSMFLGLFTNNVCLRPFTSDLLVSIFSSYRISSFFLQVFCLLFFWWWWCSFLFWCFELSNKDCISFLGDVTYPVVRKTGIRETCWRETYLNCLSCSLRWMSFPGSLWAGTLNIKNLLNCVQDSLSR